MSLKTLFIFSLSLIANFSIFGQQVLSEYKYVVVPEQFAFQVDAHEYDLNKMLQFTLNKYNFEALLRGETLPEGISYCDALQADLLKKGTLLKTSLTLLLKDCNGRTVYTSPIGSSRKKDFKIAYFESVRELFKAPALKGHKYTGTKKSKTNAVVANTNTGKKELTAKNVTQTPVKALIFELRGKQYNFKSRGKNFIITHNNQQLGEASLLPDNSTYKVEAGSLTGKGSFDDYGNFVLSRINPVNQKTIQDTLARLN